MKHFVIVRRCTAAVIALLLASPVLAQQVAPQQPVPCVSSYSTAAEGLSKGYGEVADRQGLASTGNIITIFANEDTGTWTAVVTFPDGRTCTLASGENWEDAGFAPIGDPV